MLKKKTEGSISIKSLIIIIFVILTVGTVSAIIFLLFTNWQTSARNTMGKISSDLNNVVYNKTESFIYTPYHNNEINKKLIEDSFIDFNNVMTTNKYFTEVLNSLGDEVYSFSYGTEAGDYYGAVRDYNGRFKIINNSEKPDVSPRNEFDYEHIQGQFNKEYENYDPRNDTWYRQAKAAKKPIYSSITKLPSMDELTITAALPIYNNENNLEGVLGTTILLSKLDEVLTGLTQDKNGYAMVIERNTGNLIANSFDMPNFIIHSNGTVQRININNIKNVPLYKAYNYYINTHLNSFKQRVTRGFHFINVKEYRENGIDWVVITAVPESLLIKDINHSLKLTFIFIILAVITSIIIFYYLIALLLKPIKSLIAATEKFSMGNLAQRVKIDRNDEIGKLAISFNKMASTIYWLVHDLEEKVRMRTMELENTNKALEENKDQLRLILDTTAEAIYGIDRAGKCTFCNASCIEILGYQNEDEILGKNMHFLIQHSNIDGEEISIQGSKIFKAVFEGERIHVINEIFWRADGTYLEVEYYAYPQYKDEEIVGAVVTFLDITERNRDEERIRYLSSHDALTGLLNRHSFQEALKIYDTKENLPISIIFGDVNGLKITNDIFGHSSGDLLIKKSAEVIKNCFHEDAIVARIGGDEIVMLLPNTGEEETKKIVENIRESLSKERINEIRCSVSLGYSTKTDGDIPIKRIMEYAENEMYKDKTQLRKSFGSNMINTIIESLHQKSPKEKIHSEEVSKLCSKFGEALDLPKTEIKKLEDAAYYHDIGKIVLDTNLINKEEGLTEGQRQEILQHPVVSYRILNLFDETLDLATDVYAHHEKWDGSGYPKGLKGEEIPLISRILAISESYERLLSKSDHSVDSIKRILTQMRQNAGKAFDPELTEKFIRMIENTYSI